MEYNESLIEYVFYYKFYESLIDEEKYPINENKSIEFVNNIEKIICELFKVKFGGINDGPEDWVGAIKCAFDLNWREQSKKCIFFCQIQMHMESYFAVMIIIMKKKKILLS